MKAFPTDRLGVIAETRDISINQTQQDGMDLRDYFAAKALGAILMDFKYREMLFQSAGDEKIDDPELATRWCLCNYSYELADMMMEVRNGK